MKYIVVLFLSAIFLSGILWIWYKRIIPKVHSPKPTVPIRHSGVPIRFVQDTESCKHEMNNLMSFNPSFVGLDCEWKPNRKRGIKQRKVALIQIAHSNVILLIQIHLFSDNIPIELIAFLGNVDIIKCGVGINGDARKLKSDYNLTVHGCVDLNAIYKMVDSSQQHLGLEKFANLVLDEAMIYKHGVNHDHWEREQFNFHQTHYAADDALVAFKVLQSIMKSNFPQSDIMEVCFGKIDTNLSGTKASKKRKDKASTTGNNSSGSQKKDRLRSRFPEQLIAVLLPNNELLSFVPFKTAQLLIRKQWATIPLESDPSTIQMTFVPDPIDERNDNLFKWVRGVTVVDPCCVVCGYIPNDDGDGNDDDNTLDEKSESDEVNGSKRLLWHSLIPSQFKIYPCDQLDPYRLLMCTSCQMKARTMQDEIIQRNYDLWYKDKDELKYIETLWNTRNTAWKLKHSQKRSTYSVEEQNEFVQEVLAYCKEENAEDIVIKESDFNIEIGIDWFHNKKDWRYIVIRECIQKVVDERTRMRVEHIRKRDEYLKEWRESFGCERTIANAERWRRHFMDTMQPKFINMERETFEIAIDRSVVTSK